MLAMDINLKKSNQFFFFFKCTKNYHKIVFFSEANIYWLKIVSVTIL